jgi:hypothetical protein
MLGSDASNEKIRNFIFVGTDEKKWKEIFWASTSSDQVR